MKLWIDSVHGVVGIYKRQFMSLSIHTLYQTPEGNISSAALATNDSGSASEYKSLYDDKEISIPGAQSKLELLDGVDSQTYPKKKLQILTFMRGPRGNGACPRAHGRNDWYDCVIYQTVRVVRFTW